MHASVIVPSYNSRSTIARCLNALMCQKTGFSYEIIVVDSSNDGTGELIESSFPTVKLTRVSHRTFPGKARNLGIEVSRGEILAFTDADCVPAPLWLDKMIREQEKGSCSAVGGAVLNGLPWNPVACCDYLLEFSERLPSFPRRFVNILPTCNVSFRRSVFARYGLFPEDLEASEDQTFSWRLVQAGERLLFDPEIRIQHIFRHHLTPFVKHQSWLGRGSAMARRQVNLPQAWLAGHPLRWLVPAIRLLVIEARLARWDRVNFLRFNFLLPLCLTGLIAWGIGFCRDNAFSDSKNLDVRQ
jgi:glycosyltransferase involved in cell wall biosynthesis